MSHAPTNDDALSPNNTHYSHNTHSFNYTHFVNTDCVWNVNNIGETDERSEILAWLSPLEPRLRHQDIRTRRADNVGEWVLQAKEFQRWCDGVHENRLKHATLFCCGDPAVGKTYLSSLVVDRLCDKAKEQNIAIACFYVDFAAREEQSPTNLLGSLLKQIVGGLERMPEEITRTFQDYKKVIGGRGLRVPEILKMLQIVASLQPTFICVDALDECAEGHRPEILDSLRQILEKSPNMRVFLTGRRHICGEIERHLGGRAAILSIKPSNDDIAGYIRMRLSKDTSFQAMDDSLEAEIIKTISENIPETFLLISLTMDAILGETTPYGRRRKLGVLTDGLDLKGIYGATIGRIKEQGGEKTRLAMAALMWISHSERLLQLDELFHALAIEIGSTDLNRERIPSAGALLDCCLGLVAIDREASTVRLIHFTLQEYLCSSPNLFSATHSIMAETCLTYLNFQAIKEIPPAPLIIPQSAALLKYSSLHWGAHARRDASRGVVSLALKLFSQIESHISTRLLLADLISRTGRYISDIPISGHLIGFTGLHCVSALGIVEIVAALVGQPNPDLNKRDFLGITPLVWAAICGREAVAKLLLEQRTVIPDKPDKFFSRTALSWAARKGHKGMVGLLLLRASARPDGTDGWWSNIPRVMGSALGRRYVDPNKPDKYGQTPISSAAEEGHEGVVKLLLGRKDVKPDTTDGYGSTSLFWACSKGRDRVVKHLLDREDVKIDSQDQNGQTLLLAAAESGYEAVVELLLRRKDTDPNTRSKAGHTSLSIASRKGHEAVVKLLLDREDLNPNMPDQKGLTPLLSAAEMGHTGVVKLLLGRKDVNLGKRSETGQTSLSLASGEGHDGVVKLLLDREDLDPNTLDKEGLTPLSLATEKGHCGAVELLLGRKDLNPNIPDRRLGRTPLSLAAGNGNDGLVKLLLGREDVSPDMPDNGGLTPLLWAAWYGNDGAVKLLLGREDVNPNMPDQGGRTPLSWAARNGNDGVVKILLGREDVNPIMPDSGGQTPLSRAAWNGHDGVVRLLLGRKDVNPDIPDHDGQTPLSLASMDGHEGAAELLLGQGDVNPNRQDNFGFTPISWASFRGRAGVVKLLLRRKDINPNTPNHAGQTPLSLAAMSAHDGIVKLLLEREDIKFNVPEKDDKTALLLAPGPWCKDVVKLLQTTNPEKQNPSHHPRKPPLTAPPISP